MRPFYQPWQWLVIVAGFALLIVIGWLDYITGYEFGFFIFYSIPVGLLAWYVGRGPGIAISFASALTWLIADLYAGQKYSSPFMLYWNMAVRSVCFIINAVTMAKIKQTLDQRKALAAELAGARALLGRLEAWWTACPVCRRQPDGPERKLRWQQFVEGPAGEGSSPNLCPECRARFPAESHLPGADSSRVASPVPPITPRPADRALG